MVSGRIKDGASGAGALEIDRSDQCHRANHDGADGRVGYSADLPPFSNLPEASSAEIDPLHSDILAWPDFSVTTKADWHSSSRGAASAKSDCCLVLSFVRAIRESPTKDWTFIVHETGGIWQEAKQFLVLKLQPSENGLQIAHQIARHMAESNISARFAEFDQLIAYRRLLNEHGLDCNDHIQGLAEAYYPIDATDEALTIFGVTRLPVEAVDFIERGMVTLAILAPNCSDF